MVCHTPERLINRLSTKLKVFRYYAYQRKAGRAQLTQ
jgi:hypothetical protein